MGFGVWGLGFGVWGLGFGVWGLGVGGLGVLGELLSFLLCNHVYLLFFLGGGGGVGLRFKGFNGDVPCNWGGEGGGGGAIFEGRVDGDGNPAQAS